MKIGPLPCAMVLLAALTATLTACAQQAQLIPTATGSPQPKAPGSANSIGNQPMAGSAPPLGTPQSPAPSVPNSGAGGYSQPSSSPAGSGNVPLSSILSSLFSSFTNGNSGTTNQGNQPSSPTPSSPTTSQPSNGSTGGSGSDSLTAICLKTINDDRASIGVPALTLNSGEDSCSDEQTGKDGEAGTAHANFGSCEEMAQDECPGYDASDPSSSLTGCLAQMWAEGPGGGHYENMSNASYRSVACGFNSSNGSLWMVQNFYP